VHVCMSRMQVHNFTRYPEHHALASPLHAEILVMHDSPQTQTRPSTSLQLIRRELHDFSEEPILIVLRKQ
jgi:hypothetical protein